MSFMTFKVQQPSMIIAHTASVEKLQRLKNYFQFFFVSCLNKMNISAGLLCWSYKTSYFQDVTP